MDVKNLVNSKILAVGVELEVSGWLVDKNNGLFLLGDHYPEDVDFPIGIRISNSNIIYAILKIAPQLGGGKSILFYKTKIIGRINENKELEVNSIFIQTDRGSSEFQQINIDAEMVKELVKKFGDYKFSYNRNPMQDWLDNFM